MTSVFRERNIWPTRALRMTSTIFFGIFLVFYCHVNYAQSTATSQLNELRCQWVGQYPHKAKKFFLNEPKIKNTLQQLLNKNRFDALVSGDYLEAPIDYVAGYYVVSFAPNLHLMQEEEWVYILIREHTGSVHVAIKDSEDRVQWKHSAESDFPFQILKMLDLPDKKT